MIKAVLFDFDETLQDRTLAFEKYMDTFMQKFLPDLPEEEVQKRRRDMVETGNGGYVNRVNWYQSLIDLWGWEDAPPAEVLAEHYDTQFGLHNVIFEGSVPLLKELRKRGFITGVITNGPSVLQHMKMEESGLMPYLDIVVVSGDIDCAKPDAGIFTYTAERLGLKPEECVYVGDHPINDIQGAIAAGMKPIRMNFGWFENQDLNPDIPTVTEIYDVINYI